jgi:hypothetical protein
MKKHQTVKFVAVLLFIAAVVLLLLGLVQAIIAWSGGLGAGWGAGWRGWILLPTLFASICAAIPLIVAGALLYFLAQIEQNLSVARTQPRRTPGRVEVVEVPAATEAAVTPQGELAAPVTGAVVAGVAAAELGEEQTPSEAAGMIAPEVTAPGTDQVRTPEVAAPAAGVTASAAGIAAGAVAAGVAAVALSKEEAPAEAEAEATVAAGTAEPEGPVVIAEPLTGAAAVEVAAPVTGIALPAAGAIAATGVAAAALGREEPSAATEASAPQIEAPEVAAMASAGAMLPEPGLPQIEITDLEPGAPETTTAEAAIPGIESVTATAETPGVGAGVAGVAGAALGKEGTPEEQQVVAAATGSEDDMSALQEQLATLQARISDLEATDVVPETQDGASDLLRISGISEEYRGLLEASGVDTVPDLAQQNAANLYERLMAVNLEKHLVPKSPTLTQVAAWIEQANQLP